MSPLKFGTQGYFKSVFLLIFLGDALEQEIQKRGIAEFVRTLRYQGLLVGVGKDLRVPARDLVSLIYAEFLLAGLEGRQKQAFLTHRHF